jgi:hypothetical protein
MCLYKEVIRVAKLQLKFMDGFFVAVMLLCALSWWG